MNCEWLQFVIFNLDFHDNDFAFISKYSKHFLNQIIIKKNIFIINNSHVIYVTPTYIDFNTEQRPLKMAKIEIAKSSNHMEFIVD